MLSPVSCLVSSCPPAAVITSSSTREYTVTEPEQPGAAPSSIHTYQWRQTITFQDCVHDSSRLALPSTQQLSVDSVFVLYNQEERILRYALSNSIGPVRGERRPPGWGACAGPALCSVTCYSLSPTLRERKLCENSLTENTVLLCVILRKPAHLLADLRPPHCPVWGGVRVLAVQSGRARAAAGCGRASKTL